MNDWALEIRTGLVSAQPHPSITDTAGVSAAAGRLTAQRGPDGGYRLILAIYRVPRPVGSTTPNNADGLRLEDSSVQGFSSSLIKLIVI